MKQETQCLVSGCEKYFQFFKEAHQSIKQTRNDGFSDYFDCHVARVAQRVLEYVKLYAVDWKGSSGCLRKMQHACYIVALAHDYFEDVAEEEGLDEKYSAKEAIALLKEFQSVDLLAEVMIITNTYSKKNFPYLNHKQRKTLEANRLLAILDGISALVKIADIEENSKDAPTDIWRKKKLDLLQGLVKKGEAWSYHKCPVMANILARLISDFSFGK